MKTKSLTFEREFEFEYREIGEIADWFAINGSQNNFAFWLLVLTGVSSALVGTLLCSSAAYPFLLRIEQVLYIGGLVLYLTSFKKSWYFQISDRNDNVLIYIKQTRRNRELLQQALELMRSKSEDLQEVSAADPFPPEKPLFEHIYYDPSTLKRTTDRFYPDHILGFEKSLFSESVYSIQYSRLSGKVYRGKFGSDLWGLVLTVVTLLSSLLSGFFFAFAIPVTLNLAYLLLALAVLFLISLALKMVKREVVGLYDKNEKVAYWAYIKKANKSDQSGKSEKENIEEIIKFIQSKILSATNNDLLKEQA